MKKIKIFAVVFIFLSFFIISKKDEKVELKQEKKEEKSISIINANETRAVYISYIELDTYIKDKTDEIMKKNISSIIKNIKSNKFNTIILHVRPFSDAIYKKSIYPVSKTVLNKEGKYPSFDILEYFIKESHNNGIKLHAWINPYRISNETNTKNIEKNSINYKYLNTSHVSIIKDKGIYYNPASTEVKNLILKGIKEIVKNYDIDGIHFDDYFYPDKKIDLKNYEIYKAAGGKLTLDKYRLENITTLIKDVYTTIKSLKKDVLFGIAPEGNIDNNYTSNYIDTKKILSNSGYVDYIMPQIYFGFLNEAKPYIDTIKEWNSLISVNNIDLIPALAMYKSGSTDEYAKNGSNEWIIRDDIIKRQVIAARSMSKYNGFSIFRYDYLFNENKKNTNLVGEFNNLKDVL